MVWYQALVPEVPGSIPPGAKILFIFFFNLEIILICFRNISEHFLLFVYKFCKQISIFYILFFAKKNRILHTSLNINLNYFTKTKINFLKIGPMKLKSANELKNGPMKLKSANE